jgi:epimerase transport system membrane fusion protein
MSEENKKTTMPSYDTSGIISFGLGVIFIVFGILGGWMALAPLAESSVAVGKVSADLSKKTIQHLEGGIVEKIYVKDGDNVKKGQVLLKLKDIHIKGQLLQIQKQIDGLESLNSSKQKRLASLNEELKELDELYKQKLIDKLRIRDLYREISMVEGDIAKTYSDIAKLQEQAIIIKDVLSRTKITAPISGKVVAMDLHTEGGVLAPGKPVLEIVPSNTKLLVVAQVIPTDIDKVKIGLLANITFSAFDLNQVNEIKGKVVMVSADSYVDQATNMPYYEAKIEVTKEGMNTLKQHGYVLVPGMPAQVMIQIGDRTALSYLVKPFTQMLNRSFNEE